MATVVGTLEMQYAADGYASLFSAQTTSWGTFIPLLQDELRRLLVECPESASWGILVEYPLYRLRKRIDAVVIGRSTIIVVEVKVGEETFERADKRQVEEYALDLRDFHGESSDQCLVPVLWATMASPLAIGEIIGCASPGVARLVCVGQTGLKDVLAKSRASVPRMVGAETWDAAPYRPVPTIVEAATAIFSRHGVAALARADATNLRSAARRLVELVHNARGQRKRALIFLTGVPGSGKTLAGLDVVHSAVQIGMEERGDIVYLSGNGPLVMVLREALARDVVERGSAEHGKITLASARRDVRTRIQHINDFLKDAVTHAEGEAPHEHVIVFDEAQRAWDEKQGKEKFNREASEPTLLLEIMMRHRDWCACICLVGGGQEINTGEQGISGWGDALRAMDDKNASTWTIYAPPDVLEGGASTGGGMLGELPLSVAVVEEPGLELQVPMRSYRSPALAAWVDAVLEGHSDRARTLIAGLDAYPIVVTRSLANARAWLRSNTRGQRRCGLVASSGARRLRADGIGEFLTPKDGAEISNWYLNEPDDLRSSSALEVPANEYACQGLELDFVGVCWGGDLIWSAGRREWRVRRLNGVRWQNVNDAARRRYAINSYRVLLTRAREGLVIWVPTGSSDDSTRNPVELDATADFLMQCGARDR